MNQKTNCLYLISDGKEPKGRRRKPNELADCRKNFSLNGKVAESEGA